MTKIIENIEIPQYNHIVLSDAEINDALFKTRKEKGIRIFKEMKEGDAVDPRNYELTGEETKEALRLARKKKESDQLEAEYINKITRPKEYEMLTANELQQRFKDSGGVIFTSFNEGIIYKLCQYFTNDSRFAGLLNKGILLAGPIGCGKSFLMNLFRANQKASYIVKSCRDISYEYGQVGFDVLMRYSKNLSFTENKYGHTEYGICFDDLGTDEERKFYGNNINAMSEIILSRYDNNLFHFTHLTTNLDGDQVEKIYGPRIRSRIREMFNVIKFDVNAKDMRK